MKRRTVIVCAIISLLVIVGVVCVLVKDSEPSYNGKTLTQWLVDIQKLGINDRAKYNECRDAIYTIGTNAIPSLIRMVDRTDSPLKVKAVQFLGPKWSDKLKIRKADYYRSKATFGFSALREKSAPSVPALIVLLHSRKRDVQAAAAECLSDIGPEAGSATADLVDLLHHSNANEPLVILSAMDGLRGPGRDAKLAVPELLIWINGERKSWNYISRALDALRAYGTNAAAASPAIVPYLDDPEPSIKASAFSALYRIDRVAAEKWQREQWAKQK